LPARGLSLSLCMCFLPHRGGRVYL
jgi:hypothetical protein